MKASICVSFQIYKSIAGLMNKGFEANRGEGEGGAEPSQVSTWGLRHIALSISETIC